MNSPFDLTQTPLQPGTATCSKGFVISFLKVPLACLGSMAAAVQPNGLWNSQKTFYKTFFHNLTPSTPYTVHSKLLTSEECARILHLDTGYLVGSDDLCEGECLVSMDVLWVRVGQLALRLLSGDLLLVLSPHCLGVLPMRRVRPSVVTGRLRGSPLQSLHKFIH